MAVQQRRVSKTRKRKRRTHYKLTPPTLVPCERCGQLTVVHHVCPKCRYYRDRQVLEAQSEE